MYHLTKALLILLEILNVTSSAILGTMHEQTRKLFMDEINVMKRVSDGNNPHVLKMLGCVTTTNPMMLVLQFVPHGNLKDYLRAMKTVDDVRNTVWQLPLFNALRSHNCSVCYVIVIIL